MKKLKLFFAALALLGWGNLANAQTPDKFFPSVFFPNVSDDLPSASVADPSSFTALSGDYTIEVEGTANSEITFPYDRYRSVSYTPTVTGTIRFVSTSTAEKVFVYEKATGEETFLYKGKATITDVKWPAMETTNVSDDTNLLGNPDFQEVGDAIDEASNKYKLGSPWVISNENIYGSSKIRQGKNNNSHDNEGTTTDCFVWRIDGNAYDNAYFYQKVNLKPNGKYKYRVRISQNTNGNGTYYVRLGKTQGGEEYSSVSFTITNNTTKQVKSGDLTTPAELGDNSYFSVKNGTKSSSNTACTQIDLFQLVEAVNVATEITGVTSAKFVSDAAISPICEGNVTAAIKNPFIENGASPWIGGATEADNQYTGADGGTYLNKWNGVAIMYQDVSNLPQGQYTIKVATRASTETPIAYIYAEIDGEKIGVTSIGRNGDTNEGTLGKGWKWINVDFYKPSAEGNVRIGFYADCSNGNWAGADEFYLTYRGNTAPITTTISEEDNSAPTAYSKANVTLSRTLKAHIWNTISLPFNLSIDEIHASALSGAEIKKFSSVEGNVINFEDATEIVAGDPYLIKLAGTDNVASLKFYNVAVQEIAGNEKGAGDYKFAAQIYNKSLAIDGTVAYLSTNGTIKKLTSGGIKGLRAYFIIPAGSTGARIAFTDGDQTGIKDSFVEATNDNRVYDLQGRQVKAVKKGIYVVNGKKVIK